MRNKKQVVMVLSLIVLFLVVVILLWPKKQEETHEETHERHSYGVFLSMTSDDKWKQTLQHYDTLVIDAQYFSKHDITWLKQHNGNVLTYINIGSIEDFRPYYQRFQKITIKPYEHWEEERWVDVNHASWQTFMKQTLIPQLLNKGVDGFFVDNLDIYDIIPKKETIHSLTNILSLLRQDQRPVLINGADTFVSYCMKHYPKALHHWFSGVNQETVLTAIDFDHQRLKKQTKEEFKFYHRYLQDVSAHHLSVYLLEYTKNQTLIKQIQDYCQRHHYHYYISDSIELDG